MPSGPQIRAQKLRDTESGIKEAGWRSTPEFSAAYYESELAQESLKYYSGRKYHPERVLDAWFSRKLSAESRRELETD
ncbi:hypothetical protein Moror_7496 [Moniliophthora roreri MCA 2997]|uniref:Uncharacterized protein n=1 Tax=Moniliophthora roreri (strain MCA 2997) TaxID=1381753 RepID=V2XX42_MONRO|nr:hypothetical protein Moror_7496 [Moniliophthora roreri MCA 2997]